jgi:hypothetical protein
MAAGREGRRMTKRLAVLAAALAVLGLVVSMIVPAVADNGGERVTLRLAEKAADDEQFDTEIDVGKKGFSPGDYIVLGNEPVYNRALTKKVGTVSGDVLFVSVSEQDQSAVIEVDISFNLKGGLITVEGPIDFSQDADPIQTLAVTGGTGAYKTAHGELHIDISGEEGFLFTFKLFL